jgi:hypothetical protein
VSGGTGANPILRENPPNTNVSLIGVTNMSKVAIFLIALVIVAGAGLLTTAIGWPVRELPTEIVKALLQLVVVAVAGHVVSILITKSNNERQDLMRENELRRALLDRLNEAFVDVKKVRRIARATSEKVKIGDVVYLFIQKTQFHGYLQDFNEAQLDLEIVSKDIESNKLLFADADQVIKRLDRMEEYLNSLVDEYEHSTATTVSDPADCLAVSSLACLSDILGPYKSSKFRTEFVHTYYANLESIREAFSSKKRIV